MLRKRSTLIWTFLWSIFMGVTVGSIGLGAAFPSLNLITQPVVCRGGSMELETADYHPSPVETVTTQTWYCVDNAAGVRREISPFKMAAVAGPLYGLLLFAVILAVAWLRARRGAGAASEIESAASRGAENVDLDGEALGAEQRLQRLKDLLDRGLITQQDYDRKKNGS